MLCGLGCFVFVFWWGWGDRNIPATAARRKRAGNRSEADPAWKRNILDRRRLPFHHDACTFIATSPGAVGEADQEQPDRLPGRDPVIEADGAVDESTPSMTPCRDKARTIRAWSPPTGRRHRQQGPAGEPDGGRAAADSRLIEVERRVPLNVPDATANANAGR